MGRRVVGIYGGTFNTFHSGHKKVAELSLSYTRPRLDLLLVVPARRPYFKNEQLLRPYQERLQGVKVGMQGVARTSVADLDEKLKPSYSINLIAGARDLYGTDSDIVLVIGSDILSELHRWHKVDELVTCAKFWVAGRGAPLTGTELKQMVAPIIRDKISLSYIGATNTAISSSELMQP